MRQLVVWLGLAVVRESVCVWVMELEMNDVEGMGEKK